MTATFYTATPAYASSSAWRESNRALAHLVDRHRHRLDTAVAMAAAIRLRLESLFPVMEALCRQACRFCPEPCCIVATVWLDFRDLLFLHLGDLPLPGAQLIGTRHERCRYLGPRGCRLPRIIRPWACTVYLCPPHVRLLGRPPAAHRERVERTVAQIKALRREMETEFIRIVA